jgi:signal transduction histidine kinase
MASRLQPDLILLDVLMPDMNGFEACKVLKDSPETSDIPVIFMTALTDTKNKVLGFQCGAVDYICKPFQQEEVLARIHTHLLIRNQRKSLLMSNHIKEKILSVVAHDLRNPFQVIFGYLDLLSNYYDRYDDEKRKDIILSIRSANNNLFALVEDLLSWVTAGNGHLEYSPKTVQLCQLTKSAVNITKALSSRKHTDLTVDVDENIYAFVDENMLSTIIRNLLTNALKFTPKNGAVWLEARSENSTVTLTVRDTGVGLTPDQIEKIKKGEKLHSTHGTEKEPGTGMGMVICLEFIKMIGGSLHIESTSGKGSAFRVTIPSTPIR